jgi:isopenicillin N synthase-like dioxygenase
MSAAVLPIPTLSLQELDGTAELGERILRAVVDTGFFYLKNHGIGQDKIDAMFGRSKQLFLEEKESVRLQFQDRVNNTGYTPVKQESLDPTAGSDGDLKESFYLASLRRTCGGSNPTESKYQPPPQKLPPTLHRDKEEISDFIEGCQRICSLILAGLAQAMHLPPNYFVDCHHGQHDRLRLIHYPPTGVSTSHDTHPASAGGSIRAGSHSDYGSCTLLFQKDVGGLQVETTTVGQWVNIPPQNGCIVVNVGDAMEFWSAGLFRSTQHRVVLPRGESEAGSRFSIAFFCQPDEDARLVPIPISSQLTTQYHDKLMDRAEFERRCAVKGVANMTELTGGQHLRARLGATYKT